MAWRNADSSNPAASVFKLAVGNIGYRFFGFVMWCAAITSVIGASYTTVSFFRTLHPTIEKHYRLITSIFILISSSIFVLIGQPAKLLVLAGAVNGLVLPFALAVILLAATRSKIITQYKHPVILYIMGWIVVLVMTWLGAISIKTSFAKLLSF